MDRRIAGTAAAIVLALAAASVWYVNSSIVPDESLPGAAATSGVPSSSAPFARSFAGTQPDGAVAAGNGELQLNPELLQRFDYYLAAVGERSVADIRAEIERDLQRELKPEAAARAKQILARYLDFKQALVQLERTPGINGQSLEAIREQLAAIRRCAAAISRRWRWSAVRPSRCASQPGSGAAGDPAECCTQCGTESRQSGTAGRTPDAGTAARGAKRRYSTCCLPPRWMPPRRRGRARRRFSSCASRLPARRRRSGWRRLIARRRIGASASAPIWQNGPDCWPIPSWQKRIGRPRWHNCASSAFPSWNNAASVPTE